MSTAAAALRAAIHAALIADGALVALLGGPRIYDEPPADAAFPYVTLGEARIADWSTGSEPGAEHQVTLSAWSRQGGHREAHLIAGALLQALDDAPLALSGHRLVNCRFAAADVRRTADGRTYHALVRFRAANQAATDANFATVAVAVTALGVDVAALRAAIREIAVKVNALIEA